MYLNYAFSGKAMLFTWALLCFALLSFGQEMGEISRRTAINVGRLDLVFPTIRVLAPFRVRRMLRCQTIWGNQAERRFTDLSYWIRQ